MPSLIELKDRSPRWAKDVANAVTRRYALATVSRRTRPDFLVIGTKRGGTTSLFNYLMMHEGILGLFPQSRGRKSSDYFFKNIGRGEDWYRSHFHTRAHRARLARRLGYEPVAGEASPYYVWDPRIAAEAHRVNPELKAVVLLRDPVKRAGRTTRRGSPTGSSPCPSPMRSTRRRRAPRASSTAWRRTRATTASPTTGSPTGLGASTNRRSSNWRSVFPADQLLVLAARTCTPTCRAPSTSSAASWGSPPSPPDHAHVRRRQA